jgi:hypothetical protein
MDAKGNQADQESAGAVPLSPEFLAGGTEAGLEKMRTRLLDLTNRNRLLNFRHSAARSLRVVGADLDETFRRLMDGGKLVFLPVPEPDITHELMPDATQAREEAQAKVSPGDYAKSLGWDTSYDLEGQSDDVEIPDVPAMQKLNLQAFDKGFEYGKQLLVQLAENGDSDSAVATLEGAQGLLCAPGSPLAGEPPLCSVLQVRDRSWTQFHAVPWAQSPAVV